MLALLSLRSLIALVIDLAALTVRNIDDELKSALRRLAAANDRSMEEEVRLALRNWVKPRPPKLESGLGTRLRQRAATLRAFDLEVPPRGPARPLPDALEE